MVYASGEGKSFVFLQGPHGPFFYELSRIIKDSGAKINKIGFNQGDRHFWRDPETYTAFTETEAEWEDFITNVLADGVTDIVLYGDVRERHKVAVRVAKSMGLRVHCFEEGYLRPYWATYERGGVNGNSALMDLSVAQMRDTLARIDEVQPEAPARWGDVRKHVLFGAIYHWHVMFRNQKYKNYKTHRDVPVSTEFWFHFKRLMTLPYQAGKRWTATRRLKRGGHAYHLVLLQLGHDSSIQDHSDFNNMEEFMDITAQAFAEGAPPHHHLVFKAHPLEDYRVPLDKLAQKLAKKYKLGNRVHFIRGGKLAQLLDYARAVVTINSTAAQQALWRGLPVKALGTSVFSKPEFTSSQPLNEFFAAPYKPCLNSYRDYRRYLLATSQVTGGFYSRKSRVRLTRQVVDMVLAEHDPYELLSSSTAAPVQQLKLVQ